MNQTRETKRVLEVLTSEHHLSAGFRCGRVGQLQAPPQDAQLLGIASQSLMLVLKHTLNPF